VKRSNARIAAALARGTHLTRDDLAQVLGENHSAVSGNRLAYVVMRAELDLLICSGAMRGKQHTYALVEERVAPTPMLGRDESLAALARRYVSGHGPAQVKDLAWWSGLTMADAKRGFDANLGELEQDTLDGKRYWFAPLSDVTRRKSPVVHLLPNYDELVIAFKDRSALRDPRLIPLTSVLSAHFILIDGRIVGGFRRSLSKAEVAITAQLLRPLTAAERKGLDAAARNYGRSLGLAVRLEAQQVP
jgi:hypothetical protein